MDLIKILSDNGITGEVADTISEAIKQNIPKEFVSKKQYEKKRDEVDTLNSKLADLEIDLKKAGTDEYKTKYETLEQEFNTFKQDIETEKVNTTKSSKLREQLKAEGFNEKLIKLLEKNFDLTSLEVEEDKIKGWEELIKPYKEEYKDFIAVESQQGQPPANPPANQQGGTTVANLRGALQEKYGL